VRCREIRDHLSITKLSGAAGEERRGAVVSGKRGATAGGRACPGSLRSHSLPNRCPQPERQEQNHDQRHRPAEPRRRIVYGLSALQQNHAVQRFPRHPVCTLCAGQSRCQSLPIYLVRRACPIARSHQPGRHRLAFPRRPKLPHSVRGRQGAQNRLTAAHEATVEIVPLEVVKRYAIDLS
jgi:hypothetical protein